MKTTTLSKCIMICSNQYGIVTRTFFVKEYPPKSSYVDIAKALDIYMEGDVMVVHPYIEPTKFIDF